MKVGDRVSTGGRRATVRYVGRLEGAPSGDWLGIEYDDARHGKHDGVYKGRRYFTCRHASPAGAFIRASRPLDKDQSVIEALVRKYVSAGDEEYVDVPLSRTKKLQMVGFAATAQRQRDLARLELADIREMQISRGSPLALVTPDLTTLDLSDNLFSSLAPIVETCRGMARLHTLNLDGNRFTHIAACPSLDASLRVHSLGLNGTGITWSDAFPELQELRFSENECCRVCEPAHWLQCVSLNLSGNSIGSLADVAGLGAARRLRMLVLSDNGMRELVTEHAAFPSLESLDISRNSVDSWAQLSALNALPALHTLKASFNPLWDGMAADDVRMGIIARLPGLQVLDGTRVSAAERRNAELYFISSMRSRLSAGIEESERLAFVRLCQAHGESAENPGGGMAPPAAALGHDLELELVCGGKSVTCTVWRDMPVARLALLAATMFGASGARALTLVPPDAEPIRAADWSQPVDRVLQSRMLHVVVDHGDIPPGA